MKGIRIAVIVAVGTLLVAPRVYAQSTDKEFKCEVSVNKAGAKFVGSKSKCVQKCLANAWKGLTPFTDCDPPSYGGATAACIITDPLKPGKSAEEKFAAAIAKACDDSADPGHLKLDCPECYTGGDCTIATGEAGARVQNIEGQVDGFVPGVGCEQAGATKEEQKCQTATAKARTKQGPRSTSADKCIANARKGLIPRPLRSAGDRYATARLWEGRHRPSLAIAGCVGEAIPTPRANDYQTALLDRNSTARSREHSETYCEGP
jgi:hypothetical protein